MSTFFKSVVCRLHLCCKSSAVIRLAGRPWFDLNNSGQRGRVISVAICNCENDAMTLWLYCSLCVHHRQQGEFIEENRHMLLNWLS